MSSGKQSRKGKEVAERDLARRVNRKLHYKTLLIVGEGITEYNYFNDLRRCLRHKGINIIVEKSRGSAPINVVDLAIRYASKNSGLDYVFCVIDRDEHKSYQEAIDKIVGYKSPRTAKSKPKFDCIMSVPCFEFWVLLHFIFSAKSYVKSSNKSAAENVMTDLAAQFPEYSKIIMDLYSRLMPRLPVAIKNAKQLAIANGKTGTINPSTNMHVLIELVYTIIGEEV